MSRRLYSAVCAVILLSVSAYAVEVEPSRLELAISPEEPTHGELQVSNHSSKVVGVRISPGAYRFAQSGLKLPSCEDWLSFKPDRFTLAAGAATTVLYSVNPPSNVVDDTAGEYLAAIQVDQLPVAAEATKSQNAEAGKITVIPRIAMPVYLMIKGKERVDLEISQVRVSVSQSSSKLLRIESTLKNRGTVHLRPSGTFALFQFGGELVRSGPLGRSVPVLPTATLTVPIILPLPPPGRYRIVITVEPQSEKVLQKEISFEVTQNNQVNQEKGGT